MHTGYNVPNGIEPISISIVQPEEHLQHVPVSNYPTGSYESYHQTNAWLIRSSGGLTDFADDLSSPPVNQSLPLSIGTAPTSPISPTSPYLNHGSPFASSFDALSVHSPVLSPTGQSAPPIDEFSAFTQQEFNDKHALSGFDDSDLLFSAPNLPPASNSFEPRLDSLDTLNLFDNGQFPYQESHMMNQPNNDTFNIPIAQTSTIQPVELQQGYLSPTHLQVPNHYDPRRYSAPTAPSDVAQFRNQHSIGSHLSDASPFEPEIDEDAPLSTGASVFRSRSYGGKPNRRQSVISAAASLSRSQSMRGRTLSRGSSRASSRNSSATRPSPYPSPSGSPNTISEHSSPSPTAYADPHLREELVKLYHLVQTGREIDPAESDWVNQMCRLHSEQILVFDPIVSPVVEQTAGQLAAMKRRREPTKMYRCFLCANELTAKHNFTRHFLSHYGIKRFKCDGCGESSTTKSDLKRHEKKCEEVRKKLQAEKMVRSQPGYIGFC